MVHSVFYANGLSRLRGVDEYTWCQTKVWSKSRVTTRFTGRKEVVKIPTVTKTNTKTLSKFDPYLGTCDDSVPPRSGRLSSSSSTQLLLLPKGRNEVPCFFVFLNYPLYICKPTQYCNLVALIFKDITSVYEHSMFKC